jgi:AraC-like DNA-binding protein
MTPETFTTQSLAPNDRYAAWQDWFQPVLDVTRMLPTDDEFLAKNVVWKLGSLVVSRVSAPPVLAVRTKAHVRRDPTDHWVITYAQRGAMVVRTETGSSEVPAGVPYLWSLGEELECERTWVDRVQLFLSRDAFRDIAPVLDAARRSVLDMPLGRLLGDYMLALERRLPSLTPLDVPALTKAVQAMVAAAVAPSHERVIHAKGQIGLGRMEQVRKAIRRHLRSPVLGPATLCRLVGISRSNLYRLLEPAGGVSRYIQRQRLQEAHSMLSNPVLDTTISAIADVLCFPEPSSFSRAFKREFGYSPSEVRSAAWSGIVIPTMAIYGPMHNITGFSDFLRGF